MHTEILTYLARLSGAPLFFVMTVVVVWAVGVGLYLEPTARLLGAIKLASESIRRSQETDLPTRSPSRYLDPSWSEFNRARVAATSSGRGVAPEEYFTERELLPKWLPSFAASMPGILTGIGILGTFTGIVLGLPSVALAESGDLMDDVQNLLGGMNTAFASSIAGIGFSLLFLVFHNARRANVRISLGRFHRLLREKFEIRTPEALLAESLVVLRSQELALKRFGTDLVVAIENAVIKGIQPAVASLTTSISNLTDEVSANQIDAIEQLVEEFRDQLSGVAQREFTLLADRITDAAETQERTTRVLTEFFGTLEKVATEQVALLDRSTAAADKFLSGIEGLDRIHGLIAESATRLDGLAATLGEATAGIGSDVELLSEANDRLREVLAGQLDSVQTQVDQLTSFWADFGQTLSGFEERLGKTLIELNSDMAAGIRGVLEGFDAEMSRVVEHLGGTLSELREVTEGLPLNVERLRDALASMDGNSSVLIERLDAHRVEIEQGTRALERLPDRLQGLLGRLPGSRQGGDGRDSVGQGIVQP